MGDCCDHDHQVSQEKNVLWTVLFINVIMFFIQVTTGIIAHSTSLIADSADMLGDAIAYGISLYAATRRQRWLAKAALIKGGIIGFFGIAVLFEAVFKIAFTDVVPHAGIMAIFSALGLVANSTCFYLLTRHRTSNINMNSAWICARNDMISNASVLIAAGLVALTHSAWPDIIIGVLLAGVLIYSGIKIIRKAVYLLRTTHDDP